MLSLSTTAKSISEVEASLGDFGAHPRFEAGGKTLMRLRSNNLIIRCDSEGQRDTALELIDGLTSAHPSRTILVSAGTEPSPPIDAEIETRCVDRMDRVLCHEVIKIVASGGTELHMASVVQPLLVSHLPTSLWWVGEPTFSEDAFEELSRLSHSLIIDSQCFTNAPADLRAIEPLVRDERAVVIDFNWHRTSIWRELIAQLFSSPAALQHLGSITSVNIQCDGSHPMQALLTIGWLGSRLGWQIEGRELSARDEATGESRTIDLSIEPGGGNDGTLSKVTLAGPQESGVATFTVERIGEDLLSAIRGSDLPELDRTTRIEWPSESELLKSAMAIRCQDQIFRQAIEAAARIAPVTLG